MSKQRPSQHQRDVRNRAVGWPRRDSNRWWRRRVFRNTYTRQGRILRVNKWSIKIQYQGKRRTISLAAASRRQAAMEARTLHQNIRSKGWDVATQPPRRLERILPRPTPGDRPDTAGKSEVDYWRKRLIRSKYMEARLTRLKEYSVRIEHAGTYQYFPLGTDDEQCAAAEASKIYQTIVTQGWTTAFQQFSREITFAIFWSMSPVACTYTTFFTFTDANPPCLGRADGSVEPLRKVFVIEADSEVRRTLVFWLSRQPGFHCAGAFKSAEEARQAIQRAPPDMLLVNRALPETPVLEFLEGLKSRRPDLAGFGYGIYQDSDQIFISLTGVTAGYIFRRRKPTELFEPIRGAMRQGALSGKEVFLQIRDYFQSLFGFTLPGEETPGLANLTAREQQTLNHVSKGFLDKEIASALGISIWTVHNHLKRIYEKLNVHTRTEAVLKYLQK